MNGTIFELRENYNGKTTYGFIFDKNNNRYFFHKKSLKNCTINSIKEGYDVSFDVLENERGLEAINVRLVTDQADVIKTEISPGINSKIDLNKPEYGLNEEEKKIIRNISKIFYVTHIGNISFANSSYRYCYIKAAERYQTLFHFDKEIVVVFSDFITFEPRCIDAFPAILKSAYSKLRLEKVVQVLICHDNEVCKKIKQHLKDNNLNQIVIPFSYEDLLDHNFNKEKIEDRFKEWLFDVDLFADKQPITDDSFFFGRRDFVNDITDKCKNGTHSGVFGLRRSGKTSILYAVQRALTAQEYKSIFLPCGTLSTFEWKNALSYIVEAVYSSFNKERLNEYDYNNETVATYFENEMNEIFKNYDLPLTLMFDEIEAITFNNKGSKTSNEWINGNNYINFWSVIKGYYSKYPKRISILVAGTNPMINEISFVRDVPNPMYETLSKTNQGSYLKPFSLDDTIIMVKTLGNYIGLNFKKEIISSLYNDCGGHPYLIRMACSSINQYIKEEGIKKPVKISKAIYDNAFPKFEKSREADDFYLMILNILMENYETEFNTLKILATDGDSLISKTKNESELHHLIGYGLIDNNNNNYAIKYNTIKNFLKGEYKFERTGLSVEEQKEEISLRMNNAEIGLRKIIKNTLLSNMGKSQAKSKVIDAMRIHSAISSFDLEKAKGLDYAQLFDPSINKIYFSVLQRIIEDNIAVFENVFEDSSQSEISNYLRTLNESRRCADHPYDKESKNWNYSNFERFREAMTWLENILKEYS